MLRPRAGKAVDGARISPSHLAAYTKVIAPIPQKFWTMEFGLRQVCDADLARRLLPVKQDHFWGDSTMRLLKTALLGSGAVLVWTGVAQAADLPVKKAAAAVQYVETCPVYG